MQVTFKSEQGEIIYQYNLSGVQFDSFVYSEEHIKEIVTVIDQSDSLLTSGKADKAFHFLYAKVSAHMPHKAVLLFIEESGKRIRGITIGNLETQKLSIGYRACYSGDK